MKIWNKVIVLLVGTAVFMCGCSSTNNKKTESTGNSQTESTSSASSKTETTISSSSQTEATSSTTEEAAHPISQIAYLRDLIEQMNESDKLMEQQGLHALKTICFVDFTQDEDPYEPIETIKIDKNNLKATAVIRIEEGDFDGHSDFEIDAIMTINGKVVDFSLDDKSSKDGVLSTTMQTNEDYILQVSADNLPVEKGENEISLIIFGYSESRDMYISSQSSSVRFSSDHEENGNVIEVCPEENINIITYQDKNKANGASYFIMPEEQLNFESDHYGYVKVTTLPSPTMHFQIDNMSTEGLIGNRGGLLLFFVDGKLQPVWNGLYIGEISLKESDLVKEIVIASDFKSGEEHNIAWYYVETHGVSEWPVDTWYSSHVEIKDDSHD